MWSHVTNERRHDSNEDDRKYETGVATTHTLNKNRILEAELIDLKKGLLTFRWNRSKHYSPKYC